MFFMPWVNTSRTLVDYLNFIFENFDQSVFEMNFKSWKILIDLSNANPEVLAQAPLKIIMSSSCKLRLIGQELVGTNFQE